MRSTRFVPIVGALLVALFLAPLAFAHAQYVSSNPANGAQVSTAPANVTITFDDDLDPTATAIVVTGPNGQTISNGKTVVTIEAPKVATVPIAASGPGSYTIKWHAVADDDKAVTEGSFGFTVGAATTANAAAAAAAPNAQTARSAAAGGFTIWNETTQLAISLLAAVVIAIAVSMRFVLRR